MKLLKKAKKAFTLVELVVVIAVIAILAAISVLSYTSITKNAKETSDHMIIDQINVALKGDSFFNKKTSFHNLIEKLVLEEGFDVRNLKPEVKNSRFVYSFEKHMFGYLQNKKITYPKSMEGTPINSDLWIVLDLEGDSTKNVDLTTSEYKEFSCYVRSASNVETINTKEGLDVGKTSGIKTINYSNTEQQSVIIRTNSAKTSLNLYAPNDTIKHYDAMGGLNIIAVATESYHEHGTVAFAEISTGRIVLEDNSDIDHIHINKASSSSFDEVILQDNGAAELPDAITRDQVAVSSATQVVKVEQNGSSEIVYVYPSGTSGSTEQTSVQNTDVDSLLGQKVLDNGSNPGEKAMSNNDKDEIKTTVISEAVTEEERQEAAEHGICVHDYHTIEVIKEAGCLNEGRELQECSICHDQQTVLTEALGHDLVGIYCNRCHHPVAFIDEIDDFTIDDHPVNKMPVALSLESLFDPAVYLYLDTSYSFKAYPTDGFELDDETLYELNLSNLTFAQTNSGQFTEQAIFNFFSEWLCDYYVSFSDPVEPYTCGLGGYYGGMAVGFLAPDLLGGNQPLPGGVDFPLLGTMMPGGADFWTYNNIANIVGEFKCGFFNLSEDNEGKTFTVKLRMLNPDVDKNQENPYNSIYPVYNETLGINLPSYIDVAVTNYTIQAPSAENMEIVENYLTENPYVIDMLFPQE